MSPHCHLPFAAQVTRLTWENLYKQLEAGHPPGRANAFGLGGESRGLTSYPYKPHSRPPAPTEGGAEGVGADDPADELRLLPEAITEMPELAEQVGERSAEAQAQA